MDQSLASVENENEKDEDPVLSNSPLLYTPYIVKRYEQSFPEEQKQQLERTIPLSQAAGYMGEQDMAFILEKMGYDIILGPGGTAGKGITEKGFDYIARNAATGDIIIGDNKALGIPGLVSEASAITTNLKSNLVSAISQIKEMESFPGKEEVTSKLEEFNKVLENKGSSLPEKIKIEIANAYGFATGISDELQKTFRETTGLNEEIQFNDLIGKRVIDARKMDIEKATESSIKPGRGYGKAIETLSEFTKELLGKGQRISEGGWILILQVAKQIITGIIGLFFETRIQKDLKEKWPEIQSYLKNHPDSGALIIFYYKVPEKSDIFNKVESYVTGIDPNPKVYNGLDVFYGKSPDEAYGLSVPMVQPTPEGWIITRGYEWYSNTECYKYTP